MKSYECYNMRHNLYFKSETLRKQLAEAEEEDTKAWEWYEGMTEEEYWACADEADRRVNETSKAVGRLRGAVDEVEKAIRLLNQLETSLGFLECEGFI